MKPKYIATIVLFLLAAGLVFWYYRKNQPRPQVYVPKAQPASTTTPESLGAQVYQQEQNPVQNQIPSSNPFDKPANPIQQSYTNPF